MNSLDINSYSKKELMDILKLPNEYNKEMVNKQCETMKKNLEKNISLSEIQKKNYITFLDSASNLLTKDIPIYSNYLTKETLKASEVVEAGGTFLIDVPKPDYGLSFSQKEFPGVFNPLEKRVLTKNLNIDSRFRENYFSSLSTDFHVDLPLRFKSVISIIVTTIEIPLSFHIFSNTYNNNFFTLIVNGISLLIQVPDGNYSATSLIQYINNFLTEVADKNSEYDLFQYILFSLDYYVDQDSNRSGSFRTIVSIKSSYTEEEPINFKLDFASNKDGFEDKNIPLPLKMGWIMGFRLGYYENNNNYVSEGLMDVGGPRYFYLIVNDYNNNVDDGFYGAFNSSILNKNILARIGLYQNDLVLTSSSALSVINSRRIYFGPVVLQKLHVQLVDEYGRIVNLNNMDFSFVLTMEYIYNI